MHVGLESAVCVPASSLARLRSTDWRSHHPAGRRLERLEDCRCLLLQLLPTHPVWSSSTRSRRISCPFELMCSSADFYGTMHGPPAALLRRCVPKIQRSRSSDRRGGRRATSVCHASPHHPIDRPHARTHRSKRHRLPGSSSSLLKQSFHRSIVAVAYLGRKAALHTVSSELEGATARSQEDTGQWP